MQKYSKNNTKKPATFRFHQALTGSDPPTASTAFFTGLDGDRILTSEDDNLDSEHLRFFSCNMKVPSVSVCTVFGREQFTLLFIASR